MMQPVLLMILDGWGLREEKEGNAIVLANTPNWDRLLKKWPNTTLSASGLSVGLPDGTMGNSEVGHLNIGAGRIVYQEYTRINKSIEDGSFYENKVLKEAFSGLKKTGASLHLLGLISDAGVHSHIGHLFALVDLAKKEGVNNIFVHCFTDGRDSPPDSGIKYIKEVEKNIKGKGQIATVSGRYYAMDRDNRWDRIALAYSAVVEGVGEFASSAAEAVERSYKNGKTDEFIVPTVIGDEGKAIATVKDGDTVIFFNFRADRARELTRAMTEVKLSGKTPPSHIRFVTMTQYDETFNLPVIFPYERLTNIFGEVVSNAGLRQLRIAETEKYAHVTFFFNGGEEKVYAGETRVLVPSPRDVPTYDKKPEMSALLVTDELVKKLDSEDVIILNYANPDMVGHSGDLSAAIKAVEAVDFCIGRVVEKVLSLGGVVLITADHGNCEKMIDERGLPHTAHTTDLVPFVLIGTQFKSLRQGGVLADIAPTMLELLEIPRPAEMTGESLVEKTGC